MIHHKKRKTTKKHWMKAIGGFTTLRNFLFFIAGMAVFGATIVGLTLTKPDPKIQPSLSGLSHTLDSPNPDEMLMIINNERMARSIPRLKTDARLTALAEARLQDMIDNQYYSHQNLGGEYYYDLFKKHGFKANYSCENLAIESSIEVKVYIKSWLNSREGHKDCLLNRKVKYIGIATGLFSAKDTNTDPAYLAVTIYTTEPESL